MLAMSMSVPAGVGVGVAVFRMDVSGGGMPRRLAMIMAARDATRAVGVAVPMGGIRPDPGVRMG